MTDQPCLRAVHVTVRKQQKISAPLTARKQPDTFGSIRISYASAPMIERYTDLR